MTRTQLTALLGIPALLAAGLVLGHCPAQDPAEEIDDANDVTEQEMKACYQPLSVKTVPRAKAIADLPHCDQAVRDVAAVWIQMCWESLDVAFGELGSRGEFFAGYVAARYQIRVPQWWRQLVRRSRFINGHHCVVRTQRLNRLWLTGEKNWLFNGVQSVDSDGDQLLIVDGDVKLSLPRSLFSKAKALHPKDKWNPVDDSAVVCSIHGNTCVIAVACDIDTSVSHIFGIDVRDGHVIWTSTQHYGWPSGVALGGALDGGFTEIACDDRTATVWYGHGMAFGFTIFDIQTGRCVGWFCSSIIEDNVFK
jgi:hypothetical protein